MVTSNQLVRGIRFRGEQYKYRGGRVRERIQSFGNRNWVSDLTHLGRPQASQIA